MDIYKEVVKEQKEIDSGVNIEEMEYFHKLKKLEEIDANFDQEDFVYGKKEEISQLFGLRYLKGKIAFKW